MKRHIALVSGHLKILWKIFFIIHVNIFHGLPDLVIEIEWRERVWTLNFSFKKPIEYGLLWSEPWCAVSNVHTQFSVSGLMRAVYSYLKISINLHENSKSNMLFNCNLCYLFRLICRRKLVALVVKLVKIFLFLASVLREDLVQWKLFYVTLHLHRHYAVVTSNNENNICKSWFLNWSFLRSCRSRLR